MTLENFTAISRQQRLDKFQANIKQGVIFQENFSIFSGALPLSFQKQCFLPKVFLLRIRLL